MEAIRSRPLQKDVSDLEGLSPAEAAATLGIPVGTVHSRLSRARARLKELQGAE